MLLSPKINSTGLPDSPAASSVAPLLHEILIPVKGGRRPLDKKSTLPRESVLFLTLDGYSIFMPHPPQADTALQAPLQICTRARQDQPRISYAA